MLVLQPLKILLNWWIITRSVAADARELVERLCLRSKLVMMRTTGLMRDADALVQHFNPACRVARMYPQLPISRLLMSINDFDIPERKQFSWWWLPYLYCVSGVLLMSFLPEILQESILDLLSGALIDFSLLGLNALGSYSVAAPISIVIAVLLLIGRREWLEYRRNATQLSSPIETYDDFLIDEQRRSNDHQKRGRKLRDLNEMIYSSAS